MKFVAYYRTSTDDKGQDPLRQKDVVDPWAKSGAHQIVGEVIDEGTSGATDPFQRQCFLEAVEKAKDKGAEGIVVENIDRATRGGIEAWMVLKAVLRIDHGLVIKSSNTPVGMPPAIEEFYESAVAMVARLFRDRLREQIKSGVARAKANGFPNGQPGTPKKPELTLAEKDLVRELVIVRGFGVDKVAMEISRTRGAFEVGDPGAMMRRRVGPTWVWKNVHRSQMDDVRERWKSRSVAVSSVEADKNGPRSVACPRCPSREGKTCQSRKGERTAYHAARVKFAAANKTAKGCQGPIRDGETILTNPTRHPPSAPEVPKDGA